MATKSQSSPTRTIPKGHPFDVRSLKPLSATLLSTTIALGHALSAYRHLSRIKSTTISPDGNLGGHGYVMSLRDMRVQLSTAAEILSTIADTLYDEVSADHWKAPLKELPSKEQADIRENISDARDAMSDPETEVTKKTATVDTLRAQLFASSRVPDQSTEPTPTDAHDWGLGFGAKGKGVENANPSGEGSGYKGTLGPYSGLPEGSSVDPGYAQGDQLDTRINTRKNAVVAALYGLPENGQVPVARSDYFDGPKDNLVTMATAELPEGYSAPRSEGPEISDTFYVQDDQMNSRIDYNEPSHFRLLASQEQHTAEPEAHK